MRKLFEADILDIFPTDNGFFYLSKEIMSGGREAGVFHKYNQTEERISQSTASEYLEAKFGENSAEAAALLGDFITCKTAVMFDGALLVSYPDGTYKIIRNGKMTDMDELTYLSSPACSPAINGRDVWFAVPDVNAVIHYSIEHGRVELRIGGPTTKAFCHPVDLKVYNNKLFICNEYSYKIRCIRLDNYTVSDYRTFSEEIRNYFRSGDSEYAVLKSGVYLINN